MKKKRINKKNGIAKFLRSPDGPKAKVIPDKRKNKKWPENDPFLHDRIFCCLEY